MEQLYVLDPERRPCALALDYRATVARECFDGEIGFGGEDVRAGLILSKGADAPAPVLSLAASVDTSMRRSWSHVRATNRHVYLVWLVRQGRLRMRHAAGHHVCEAGSISIFDSSLPFFSEALVDAERIHSSLFAVVPSHQFRTYIPDCRGLAGAPLDARCGDGRLIAKILGLLYEDGDRLDRSAGEDLLEIALKGLRRLVHSGGRSAAPCLPSRAQRLRALQSYIDQHLSDARLSASTAAQALGISPRYLSYLLKDAGVSFVELVSRKRQALAHAWLTSPEARHLPVNQIAAMAGYGSLAQFGRAFRTHHGCTPSELRRRSLGGRRPAGASADDHASETRPRTET